MGELILQGSTANENGSLCQVLGEPVEALVQACPVGGAARLDKPLTVSHCREPELLGQVCDGQGIWQVLLIGEDEYRSVAQLLLANHLVELLARLGDTVAIVRIHYIDQSLCVGKVMPPQRADLVLTADIPYGECNIAVVDSSVRFCDTMPRAEKKGKYVSEITRNPIKASRCPHGPVRTNESPPVLTSRGLQLS
jgi:hypothetical protein